MSDSRCPVKIWPHRSDSRCVLRLGHGGLHEAYDGTTRHGTVSEQSLILSLVASHLFDSITDALGIARLMAWLERKLGGSQ